MVFYCTFKRKFSSNFRAKRKIAKTRKFDVTRTSNNMVFPDLYGSSSKRANFTSKRVSLTACSWLKAFKTVCNTFCILDARYRSLFCALRSLSCIFKLRLRIHASTTSILLSELFLPSTQYNDCSYFACLANCSQSKE